MDKLHPSYYFDLEGFAHRSLFDSCNYVWEALPKIKKYLENITLGAIEAQISEGAYLVNAARISIGEGSVVEPGAYIKGPCIIGKNCTIRHGAYIRGDLIAGDHCILGHDSEFKNCILLNHAHAAHFAYVGDTVLGNRVNLGAGTVCANLKLDRGPVVVFVEGHKVETCLRKFGAILGDDVQTGCNSVTNPGTLVGKRVFCYPCLNFGGFIPEGYVIKPENKVVFIKS